MTREEAKALLPIIQAFAEGKSIQSKLAGSDLWCDCYDAVTFDTLHCEYRVKPSYRPFKNGDECWDGIQKHQPIGWIKGNHEPSNKMQVSTVTNIGIHADNDFGDNFKDAFDLYRFVDGEPFGIKEE